MNERHIETLHPAFQPLVQRLVLEWNKYLARTGYRIVIVSSWRSAAEQQALYEKGGHGARVTNAAAYRSWHNYGLAIDIAPEKDGKIPWQDTQLFIELYTFFSEDVKDTDEKYRHIRWGGDWDRDGNIGERGEWDYGHYEWHPGLTIWQAYDYLQRGYIFLPE